MNRRDACAVGVELRTRALDEPLSVLDRLRLWGHLGWCRDCREVNAQMIELGVFLRDTMDAED